MKNTNKMENIKESLVEFNVASFLKKLKFNPYTISGWIEMEGEYHWTDKFHMYDIYANDIPQPTQSLTIDWLENNFGIYVESYVDDDKTFGYCITTFTKEGRIGYHPLVRGFNSRREAINGALEYVMDNWEKINKELE